MFLSYGGDKEFIVKSYIDASFGTDLDDSKYQYRNVLNMGAIIHAEHCRHRNLQIHIDLNVADPLTKLLSQAKHDHTLVLFGCQSHSDVN